MVWPAHTRNILISSIHELVILSGELGMTWGVADNSVK